MRRNDSLSEAAVLLILLDEKILLTRRAKNLREHGGEVALPGGKREPEDTSLYRTALRECYEEVGIVESSLMYRSELDLHFTRRGIPVTPFVVDAREQPVLTLCKYEIESTQWVPISVFRDDSRIKTHVFLHNDTEYWSPVYQCNDYLVWGFTARVLVSFINKFYGGQIVRAHERAPEQYYR